MDKPILFPLLHVGKLLQDGLRSEYVKYGISHGHARILRTLFRFGDINQEKISRALHIKPPTVSRMIKSMELKGLVVRTKDEGDERVIHIELTQKGKRAALSVWKICYGMEMKMKRAVNGTNGEILRRQLGKIREEFGGKAPDFDILRNE